MKQQTVLSKDQVPRLYLFARLAKIYRYVEDRYKQFSKDEKVLAELRFAKEITGKASFQINGCTFSEGKTKAEKEVLYPFWLRGLLRISNWIDNLANRYKKSHPEKVVILKDGSPYVKVSVPRPELEGIVEFASLTEIFDQSKEMEFSHR